MNVSDGITIMNNHGFEDTDDTQKMWAINDAIWEVDGMEPWPYLLKTVNLNFDGTNPYPSNMPANFARVKWATRLSDGQPTWPERIESIRLRIGRDFAQVGPPESFYFMGQQLRFWPVPPSGTSTVLLDYRAYQPILTSTSVEADILMPARYHTIWVLGALVKLYNADDDPELAAVKKQEYEEKIVKMRMDLFVQQEMRADRIYTLDPEEAVDSSWIP